LIDRGAGEEHPGRGLRSAASRFGWGLADQALSSITNFALGLIAARTLAPQRFGVFALVFATYLITLGAVRAVVSEPFMVRFSAVAHDRWKRGASSAAGTALLLGVVGGLGCLLAALLVEGSLSIGLLALAVSVPGLLLQDTWRFAFFATRRGGASFGNDLIWALSLFLSIGILLAFGRTSVGWLVLAWGWSGGLAGLAGLLQASVLPRLGNAFVWVRSQKDLIPRYIGEFAVTTVISQIVVFGIGALAGLSQVGAFRAGQLLLGPLNVVYLGVGAVAVPEGVRALMLSSRRLLLFCRHLSLFLASCASLTGLLVWAVPDSVGVGLLRVNWSPAHRLVVPLAIGMAGFGVLLGAGTGLRALAAARLSLRARILVAPLMLMGGLGGAALSGAMGTAWGLALGQVGAAAVWWRYFVRALREHDRQIDVITPHQSVS
jgi:O-antigen/teichoic acid export membrane protein